MSDTPATCPNGLPVPCTCTYHAPPPPERGRMSDADLESLIGVLVALVPHRFRPNVEPLFAEARRARESEAEGDEGIRLQREEIARLNEALTAKDAEIAALKEEQKRLDGLYVENSSRLAEEAVALEDRAERAEAERDIAEKFHAIAVKERDHERAVNARLRAALHTLYEECLIICKHADRNLHPHPLTMEQAREALEKP